VRELWSRLQGVLHPQVPRLGAAFSEGDALWLAREWLAGRTYGQMLAARSERQLVFGSGEVLLLLRQLLPVLAALHSQELLHGDLSPDNLLRRDSDGLPVLLDFGLIRGTSADGAAPQGATPGYAPPELLRGDPAEPWMDLHALGVVGLVLLSGDSPATLLDPASLSWRWPVALEQEPALAEPIRRLLERDPARRFASAGQALMAFQGLPVPESTGPVARADRTLALVPPTAVEADPAPVPAPATADAFPPQDSATPAAGAAAAPPAPQATVPPAGEVALPLPAPPPVLLARSRDQEREAAAEGNLWPVLLALVLSAVAGTAIGWWWLSRGRVAAPVVDQGAEQTATLPPGEVSQRQQLIDRLRALQVDRAWFLRLVNASLLAQFPERRGRLPGDSLEDAPLRKVWNDQAEDWLARVEQLPLAMRQRLGSFQNGDWERRQAGLVQQGISSSVLRHLVSASAQHLLPGRASEDMPEEPFRQLWYAAAEQVLQNFRIEPIVASSGVTQVLSADVPAGGARLFAIRLPEGHGLALGVNGTPLLQMSIYGSDGTLLEPNGPLRVVVLGSQKGSPVQLLVSNEGVAPAPIRLSLRADPPAPAATGSLRPTIAPDGTLPPAAAPSPVSGEPPQAPPPVPAPESAAPAPAETQPPAPKP
jgi:serine/threonine-protein kinase